LYHTIDASSNYLTEIVISFASESIEREGDMYKAGREIAKEGNGR